MYFCQVSYVSGFANFHTTWPDLASSLQNPPSKDMKNPMSAKPESSK